MTNEELRKHLLALGNEQVEFLHPDGWRPTETLKFTPEKYRIRPQPREVFLHAKDIPNKNACYTGTAVMGPGFFEQNHDDLVKFREVLGDD